tara:strand:- start:785 stop:1117 length:333 start_codon:yes stop_codon:yes gene_type:complete
MKSLLIGSLVFLATSAHAQPPPFEVSRPDDIVISIYREDSGESRIRVSYQLVYSDGESEVTRRVVRTYNEQEALAAGYTQEQVDLILNAQAVVEASAFAVNSLPTPTPEP